MLFKRIISILLIMIFSLQLIPVRQVGSFLYQNQLTEEIPHGCDSGSSSGKSFDPIKSFEYAADYPASSALFSQSNRYLSASHDIYTSRHADDIMTPPPNSRA